MTLSKLFGSLLLFKYRLLQRFRHKFKLVSFVFDLNPFGLTFLPADSRRLFILQEAVLVLGHVFPHLDQLWHCHLVYVYFKVTDLNPVLGFHIGISVGLCSLVCLRSVDDG